MDQDKIRQTVKQHLYYLTENPEWSTISEILYEGLGREPTQVEMDYAYGLHQGAEIYFEDE